MQKIKKLLRKLSIFNFLRHGGSTSSLAKREKGFTLLELLIVIAILATLATIVVLVLNPAETLAKSRDTQRMSDLATVKSAIALYTTTVTGPVLGSTIDTGTNPRTTWSNTACKSGAGAGTWTLGEDRIWYSLPSDSTEITDSTLDAVTFSAGFGATQVTDVYNSVIDGTGWIPVKLSDVTGGSPLSNFPLDPTNALGSADSATSITNGTNGSLLYRYACYSNGGVLAFELNAKLESTEYANKLTKDGGNNSSVYEVGTKLDILGTGTDF